MKWLDEKDLPGKLPYVVRLGLLGLTSDTDSGVAAEAIHLLTLHHQHVDTYVLKKVISISVIPTVLAAIWENEEVEKAKELINRLIQDMYKLGLNRAIGVALECIHIQSYLHPWIQARIVYFLYHQDLRDLKIDESLKLEVVLAGLSSSHNEVARAGCDRSRAYSLGDGRLVELLMSIAENPDKPETLRNECTRNLGRLTYDDDKTYNKVKDYLARNQTWREARLALLTLKQNHE